MATVLLGAAGAGIGGIFGGPLGARVGFSVGTLLGGLVDQSGQAPQSRGRLEDLRITGSSYGSVIPQVWGLGRTGGNIIWALPLVESSTSQSGKGGLSGPTIRTYHYTASLALLWCKGPITRIRRIWAEDRLIYDYSNPQVNAPMAAMRHYLGTETQLADSLIAASQTSGQAPAFRGSCYTVIDSLVLDLWGNRIPAFTCEIESNEGYQRLVLAQPGLQAFYQFETEPGRLADSGPNVWNLADAGGGGSSSQITGRQGQMGYLGIAGGLGVQSFRAIPNAAVLQGPQFSIEEWFQWQGTAVNNTEILYENFSTGDFSWRLRIGTSGGQTEVKFSVSPAVLPTTTVFDTLIPQDQNWHHVAVTYDTLGKAVLYLDGAAVSTITAPANTLVIGGGANDRLQINGGDYNLDGVAIYNSLLSASDVADRWKGGSTVATVADVAADVFHQCGLVSTQWDLAGAYTSLHGGYMCAQRTEGRSVLEGLLQINFIDLAEWDGKIHAVARGGSSRVTVPLNDLGSATWDSSGRPTGEGRITTKRLQDWDLPRRLDLAYYTAIPSAVNDTYAVSLGSPTGGTFTLAVNGVNTPAQNFNITAATVQGNLANLASVGAGNVTVTGATGGPFTITFQNGLGAGPVDFSGNGSRLTGAGALFAIVQQNVANYSQAVQSATRFTKTWTQNLTTMTVPAVLDDNTARQMAERLLYDTWLQRESFTFTLPPAYWVYTPADVMVVPVASNTARVRIVSQDIGLFGPTQFQAVLDAAEILTQSVAAATVTYTGPVAETVNTTLVAFSSNALRDADTTSSGFYFGMAGAVAGEDWPGAALYWSRDGGANYQVLTSSNDPCLYGVCTTVLPAPPAATVDEYWDSVSTVNVTMTNGTPVSDSLTNVLNGSNAAMVGGELIQYATVTPLGGNSYQLSMLLRGVRGTDAFMGTHGASEQFVMAQFGSLNRQATDESLRGKTILLKAVTAGQQLAAVSPTSLLITGNEWKPYSPTYVQGARDGSNNLTITWLRRTRSGGEMRDAGDVADPDSPDSYDVEILASPGGSVVRTFSALSAATVTYTAAQQTTDFGSVQNPVNCVIYELGRYGRGYPETSAV